MWKSAVNRTLRRFGYQIVRKERVQEHAIQAQSRNGLHTDASRAPARQVKRIKPENGASRSLRKAAGAGEPCTDLEENLARKMAEYRARVETEPWLPHPLTVIHVNPHAIRRACALNDETRLCYGLKELDVWTFYGGDWDACSNPQNVSLDRSTVGLSVAERYVEGRHWKETEIFARKMAIIERRGAVVGCHNEEQLLNRYKRLDRVFEEIYTQRYRVPLGNGDDSAALDDNISVSISRYGDLLLGGGGAHRLAIAKVLNVPSIPCFVLTRHAAWMDLRESIYRRGERLAAMALRQHPDMRDCVELSA